MKVMLENFMHELSNVPVEILLSNSESESLMILSIFWISLESFTDDDYVKGIAEEVRAGAHRAFRFPGVEPRGREFHYNPRS